MLRLATAASIFALVAAAPDPNPNKETNFSTVHFDNWTKSIKLNPRVQHIPLNPEKSRLRPPPAHVPENFSMFVGSSVFRDGYRCGKTLFTAFQRATHPERLQFGILEQIYEGDPTCLNEYCKMAALEWPNDPECRYENQITIDTRDAAESAGCTTARHLQQKLVGNQEFCLQVDGHSIFTNRWDENILADWVSINNEMAILTMYPHNTHNNMVKENGDNNGINSVPHLCNIIKGGNGLPRIKAASLIRDSWMPQMAALWGGGYSFSKCHAERNVLIDSHTPWLWDGEEFMRSANYWTSGYDLYSPSMLGNVLYHNYSQKPASFWVSPIDPSKKNLDTEMSRNRVRLRIGMPFKGVVDTFELKKYEFGQVRSFESFLKFANVSFDGWMNDSNSCGQLHWVPYENATTVEDTVGRGWKLNDERVGLNEKDTFEAVRLGQDTNLQHTLASSDEAAANQAILAHKMRTNLGLKTAVAHGTGDAYNGDLAAKLRQEIASPFKLSSGAEMSTGIVVALVLAFVFVTLSNDAKSRVIRNQVWVKLKSKSSHTTD
ncbi:RxLR-like protein [Plasmopara halstedii]|uniref:RxLR-like protein n=1 Tax=Plasmopara halstedii TaxID=4781 RepID=A0A0P1B3F3_PLAHL|nr:RxLR-like protein [Plasmopara halstedii]CEG48713.1 RxLR-like protein [Plasmopara halstedii]|eukprot:XP_024585082.1 RxLR-like protein [Plasmopara halstedii]